MYVASELANEVKSQTEQGIDPDNITIFSGKQYKCAKWRFTKQHPLPADKCDLDVITTKKYQCAETRKNYDEYKECAKECEAVCKQYNDEKAYLIFPDPRDSDFINIVFPGVKLSKIVEENISIIIKAAILSNPYTTLISLVIKDEFTDEQNRKDENVKGYDLTMLATSEEKELAIQRRHNLCEKVSSRNTSKQCQGRERKILGTKYCYFDSINNIFIQFNGLKASPETSNYYCCNTTPTQKVFADHALKQLGKTRSMNQCGGIKLDELPLLDFSDPDFLADMEKVMSGILNDVQNTDYQDKLRRAMPK
jgi:hypothetical protein